MMRAWIRPLVSCVILVVLFFIVPLRPADESDTSKFVIRLLITAGGFAIVLWLVGRQVRRALEDRRALADRVGSLFMIVMLVVVFFASVYYVLGGQFHGLSTRMDSLYFTVVTLCTVGYGDIVPVSEGVRVIVTVQMLFDLVIVTSAISIVVGAVRPSAAGPQAGPANPHPTGSQPGTPGPAGR